jgi:hypothetical protein
MHGVDADRATRRLQILGLRVEPLTADDTVAAARLWPTTRTAELSLGDRCCLALAQRLQTTAVTVDTAWAELRSSPPRGSSSTRRRPRATSRRRSSNRRAQRGCRTDASRSRRCGPVGRNDRADDDLTALAIPHSRGGQLAGPRPRPDTKAPAPTVRSSRTRRAPPA